MTVFPCSPTRPTTSTLNYGPGEVVPNGAITQLSASGTVCVYTSAAADLILDVSGYIETGVTSLTTSVPARFWDTRDETTVDGLHVNTGRMTADSAYEIPVAGRNGIPNDATAAIVNVAVVFPDGPGYVTLFPCGPTRPGTSTLNHASGGVVVANNAIIQLSATGTICAYTLTGTDIIIDITGHLS